ncbi:MAG: ABC transporter [Novosphingobium sp. 28-62-57]|uniref:ABC-type transport auxiliary lipoprotein family protein n=1 Tax=unclassified Novosphingobium TaxID=2644732 RepID=UPI000BDC1A9B|nr:MULTISPECIES: ABC-type transport auxiliary lipoprotein family protein [unclassified Novosphingobium]OYW48280.1 MAG: ABC transporter [Novosphingobium sp. 12-62-10]OYZ10301.1 MAG: ABC transporter [Novosphingobium sp. 28-62-57]OZA38048.1 MAG: ABC transporter [Novosphingobium sp. 17-62-9]HQS70644.1 ABC-type transport auxiliary lipoprotein family protein [Novosphingobium sp.]
MIRNTLLAAVFVASLSGCVSLGPKAPDTLLALTPVAAAAVGSGTSGTIGTALVVIEPEADARVAVTRVPVQIDDANVAYLKKALWVERPSRLFQHLLAETIRARGTRLVIEGEPGATNQHLSGRLIDMGYDARSRMAVVRFDAVKEAGGKFETKRFESTVPVADAEAQYVGPALNEAANAVAKQVADWVG